MNQEDIPEWLVKNVPLHLLKKAVELAEASAAQQGVQPTSGWTCQNCGWLNGDLWHECPNCKTTRG